MGKPKVDEKMAGSWYNLQCADVQLQIDACFVDIVLFGSCRTNPTEVLADVEKRILEIQKEEDNGKRRNDNKESDMDG